MTTQSIGYQQKTVTELINTLSLHKVEKLLDVRELPVSRLPGFSKSKLAANLESAGIQYIHIRPAGNPHRKAKANIEQCVALYSEYLMANPTIVELVAQELSDEPVAVLCYERRHQDCHRSVLLDALRKHGLSISVVQAE